MKTIYKYFVLLIGAVFMGIAVKSFFNTAGLVTGGFSGISIMLERGAGIPVWAGNIILNVPLFFYAAKVLSKKIVLESFVVNVFLTITLAVAPQIREAGTDLLASAMAGGLFMGVGMGMILYCGSTSGGVDMLAVCLQKRLKRGKTVWFIFFLDAIIIASGFGLFGFVKTVYAIMTVFLVSFVSGKILDGPKISQTAYIISEKSDEISDAVIARMERGVTRIEVQGGYTKTKKVMLVCVLRKREVRLMRDIVENIDGSAFVWLGDANEVMGEGFVKNE